MNKFLLVFYILFSESIFAQKQIHIQYLNVRSPIANVYEDLYTDGERVISKQDGNIIWTNPSYETRKKGYDIYFISNISQSSRDFFYTSHLDNDGDFFVYDKVPQIDWKIDGETTKKILGYECTKAKAIFRGSPITAYFAKEIPYSVGPFKFYGLPGAILDVRVDGKDYDLWKAIKVDLNDTSKVDYTPEFPSYTKAQMHDYIKLKDDAATNFLQNAKVNGSTGKIVTVRTGVERVFEWESSTK